MKTYTEVTFHVLCKKQSARELINMSIWETTLEWWLEIITLPHHQLVPSKACTKTPLVRLRYPLPEGSSGYVKPHSCMWGEKAPRLYVEQITNGVARYHTEYYRGMGLQPSTKCSKGVKLL